MRLVILHRHSGAELYSGEARSLAGICDEPEARTRAIDAWLDLYALGPDMQDGVASCRACNCVVMPCPEDATEPTVFCHSCAQGFLELLVSGPRAERFAPAGTNAEWKGKVSVEGRGP